MLQDHSMLSSVMSQTTAEPTEEESNEAPEARTWSGGMAADAQAAQQAAERESVPRPFYGRGGAGKS